MAKTKKTKTNATDELIKSLGADLEPVKPFGCPLRRALPWIAFSALYAGLLAYFVGMRPDMGKMLFEGPFLFEMILVGATAIFTAVTSMYMGVPDMCGQKWLKPVSLTLLATFFTWAGTQWFATGMTLPPISWGHCIDQAAIIALLPIAALLYMVKGGTTTTPVLMSVMNVTSVGAFAYIALRITCMSDDVGHIFFFHVVPFLVVGTLLGVLARKIYKW